MCDEGQDVGFGKPGQGSNPSLLNINCVNWGTESDLLGFLSRSNMPRTAAIVNNQSMPIPVASH